MQWVNDMEKGFKIGDKVRGKEQSSIDLSRLEGEVVGFGHMLDSTRPTQWGVPGTMRPVVLVRLITGDYINKPGIYTYVSTIPVFPEYIETV